MSSRNLIGSLLIILVGQGGNPFRREADRAKSQARCQKSAERQQHLPRTVASRTELSGHNHSQHKPCESNDEATDHGHPDSR